MQPISFPTLEGLRENATSNMRSGQKKNTNTEASGPSYEMVAQKDEEG